MKAILLCSLTFALLSSTAQSQSAPASSILVGGFNSSFDSTSTVVEHFNELAQIWMRAYDNDDSTILAALYSPDAEYVSSHVQGLVAHGRDRVIANFQRGIENGGHIDSISVLSVQLSCDLATLLCRYEATNSGQKAVGRTLLVVKKVNDAWLIILHMTVV
jgi:ketosteroid isomerase-like protein